MFGRKKNLILLSLAFGIILLLGGLALLRPEPPAPREATMAELIQREGRMYFGDEDDPFTGTMVERYPTGEVKSRSILSNGVLHGVSEGWYPNGVLQVREHFREGVSHGVRTRWAESGQKISETPIEQGKITGVYRRWHSNGKVAEEVEMLQDQPHGISRAFYESGNLQVEARMEGGKVVERQRWEDGEAPARPASFVSK